VSSDKVVHLLLRDSIAAQSLHQNKRLHHRLDEAVTVFPFRTSLFKDFTPVRLAQILKMSAKE
jgi:hypothetical protein